MSASGPLPSRPRGVFRPNREVSHAGEFDRAGPEEGLQGRETERETDFQYPRYLKDVGILYTNMVSNDCPNIPAVR